MLFMQDVPLIFDRQAFQVHLVQQAEWRWVYNGLKWLGHQQCLVLSMLKPQSVCSRSWLKAWWEQQRQRVHGWSSGQVCASVCQSVCPKEADRHTHSWETVWWKTQGRSSATDCGNNTNIEQYHFRLFDELHRYYMIWLTVVIDEKMMKRKVCRCLW